MPYMQTICVFLQKMTLRTLADWKVTGRESMPPMGPLIIVSNHLSNFDPSLLACSLPRTIHFLAKDSIFEHPVSNWFLRAYGAYPLNREGVDARAYRWAKNQLARDKVLSMFPEGTRTRTGGLQKAKHGVTRLAMESQAAILPVGITGTEGLGTLLRHFNPTGTIRVNVGMPFTLPHVEGRPSREMVSSMTDMIMVRVAQLLPEEYRGVYAEKTAASGAKTKMEVT
ncbi:MAG: lysophospholipid acyltransferase family protein [Chloroflexi bacterium]|nr:lysophospholipid acyltransferase family protein [Chloroflexota bacterium]